MFTAGARNRGTRGWAKAAALALTTLPRVAHKKVLAGLVRLLTTEDLNANSLNALLREFGICGARGLGK